jgi:hypothetical protein
MSRAPSAMPAHGLPHARERFAARLAPSPPTSGQPPEHGEDAPHAQNLALNRTRKWRVPVNPRDHR